MGPPPAPAPMGSMNMAAMSPPSTSMEPMMMPAGSPMPHMGSMHSYFFGSPGFYYLFNKWFVSTTPQLVGACIGTAVIAAALAVVSGTLLKPLARGNLAQVKNGGVAGKLLAGAAAAVDMLFHYVLMLVAMTYNIWIILALVIGLGLGQIVNLTFPEKLSQSPSSPERATELSCPWPEEAGAKEDKLGDDDGKEHGCDMGCH